MLHSVSDTPSAPLPSEPKVTSDIALTAIESPPVVPQYSHLNASQSDLEDKLRELKRASLEHTQTNIKNFTGRLVAHLSNELTQSGPNTENSPVLKLQALIEKSSPL